MKFMGSKGKIANDILPIILRNRKEGQTYVEPFVGGCNSMCKVTEGRKIASDKNEFLIAMWIGLQRGIEFPTIIQKEYYSSIRDSYNTIKKNNIRLDCNNFNEFALIGWVGFMGSFNGRFFDGGYSGHDISGRNYIDEQIRNTLSQVGKLKDVTFVACSYEELVIPDNSIVYNDIPYKGTKQYDISKNFDYSRFWDWCRELNSKGHKVFVSEYEAPDDFICVWKKTVTNSLNTTKTYRPVERLFTLK